MSQVTYEQLIEKCVEWAGPRPDIHAVMLLGSRARTDHPADEWSDVDIALVVANPQPYLKSADWLMSFGEFWITFVEPTATANEMERRVLFAGGLDADFSFIPYAKVNEMMRRGVPPDVAEMFHRGWRVLVDKINLETYLRQLPVSRRAFQPPSQAEFLEVGNDFWYHAVFAAKKLRRGELWVAKACCDDHMKRRLLMAIELHARVFHDADYDTWHGGRFLEQWADPRILAGLREAFAHYDEDDLWRALLATMDLFRWVTKEIAECLGYLYPPSVDEYATRLVWTLASQRHRGDPL